MGEGRELYNKAIEAGDMSIYSKGMSKIEEKEVAEITKPFNGSEDEARTNLRKRQMFQADRENDKHDEVKTNLARPYDEVYNEAMAVQNIAIKYSDRGASAKPTSKDYKGAQRAIEDVGKREGYALARGENPLTSQPEVIDRNARENEQRGLISESVRELIMEVARSKFSGFLDQYRAAKSIEKESLKRSGSLVSPEIQAFWNDFDESVLSDQRLMEVTAKDKELQDAVTLWARRLYKKELGEYLDREMEADHFTI